MSNMSNKSYYISWAKQENVKTFEIHGSKDDYYLRDNGQKIFDLSSTSYHASFGHSYPPIVESIKQQLDHFTIASPKSTFKLKEIASKKLLNYLKIPYGKIFYTVSGAEAIENAIKMARKIKGRKIILARKDSYHGATLGALSITGDWRNDGHFTIDEWTKRIPSPDDDPDLLKTEELILKIGPENIAAFCLETITGGNGVKIPSKNWWKKIQALSQKYNLFLILDEVVCGFNRAGKAFGFHHFDLKPDLVCMAKGITAGMIPFGAVCTSQEIATYYDKNILSQGLTNYAHPLGLKVMNTILDLLNKKEIIDHISLLEQILIKFKTQFLSLKKVIDVRQVGLLMAIETNHPTDCFDLINDGVLISKINNNWIIAPPYTMKEKNLEESLCKLFNKLK